MLPFTFQKNEIGMFGLPLQYEEILQYGQSIFAWATKMHTICFVTVLEFGEVSGNVHGHARHSSVTNSMNGD